MPLTRPQYSYFEADEYEKRLDGVRSRMDAAGVAAMLSIRPGIV